MARPQIRYNTGSGLARQPSGLITHGNQLTTSNTGYGAYFDPGLGRLTTLADLTVQAGTHNISDFTGGTGGTAGNPKVVKGFRFTGDVLFDVPYVTARACLFDNPTTAFVGGSHIVGAFLDYCTVSPATVGAECMHFESWSANRSHFRGCSDGARVEGGALTQDLTECLIGVKMASSADHNDGLQTAGGDGLVRVTRCNISVDPEGGVLTGGSGGPDSAILCSNFTAASNFRMEVRDSLLNGGTSVETLRLYDGALTTNITYLATGNRWVRTAAAPVGRGSSNTTPMGQITWSGNVWDDDGSTIPLV